jgi:hypothetical protein
MSNVSVTSVVWVGKPWIIPATVMRTVLVFVVAAVVVWLEVALGAANYDLAGAPAYLWTIIVFFILWAAAVGALLIQRYANTYLLHNDSIEIRTGLITLKSYLITPLGFMDLEVIKSVPGRILNYGDIILRLQGDRSHRLLKIRQPFEVGDQIRAVMARPVVRINNPT